MMCDEPFPTRRNSYQTLIGRGGWKPRELLHYTLVFDGLFCVHAGDFLSAKSDTETDEEFVPIVGNVIA